VTAPARRRSPRRPAPPARRAAQWPPARSASPCSPPGSAFAWTGHQADPRSRPRRLPFHYLRHNLYATTSGVFSHAALLGAVHAIGIDRLLFAVDYPYESTAEAVDFLRTAPFAPADLERIAHGNAKRLLHL
jgi:predicted TIM-barrel fold metal-dependent hydrolase